MSKKKILVADDSATIRLLLKKFLSEKYEVIEAENGRQTLKKFKKEMPVLLVLDLQMPIIDGFSVCEAVKKDTDVPVIILTSMDEKFDKEWAGKQGADMYLKKPVNREQILEAVEKYI